jgi:hypothetical protein
MFRRISFLAALGAAVVTALALAGSALAAPTTPSLKPMPFYVPPDQTLAWTPSVLDANAVPQLSGYYFVLIDVTAAQQNPGGNVVTTKVRQYTLPSSVKLNALFPGVVNTHQYQLCVRAVEITDAFQAVWSPSRSCATFQVWDWKSIVKRIADQYVSINPDPGCIQCGLAEFVRDPGIAERLRATVIREPAPITGLRVDVRGDVSVVAG